MDVDSRKIYEERMKFLEVLALPQHVIKVQPELCQGKSHLQEFYKKVVQQNGEGVMLRQAESLYESGRSNTLKKYKNFMDTEVKMIKKAEDKQTWALVCEQYVLLYLLLNINTTFIDLTDKK